MGEKSDALEPFHPDRIASRILGMGDMMSLIEELEQKVDRDQAAKVAAKMMKGQGFSLEDFRDQLVQMRSMGGMMSMLDKLPGMKNLPAGAKDQMNNKQFGKMEAIINSMTKKERRNPGLLNGSRRARIARGSGTTPADVNKLLKQFQQMEKMMSKLSQGGMKGMLRGMKGLMGGGFPGRFPGR